MRSTDDPGEGRPTRTGPATATVRALQSTSAQAPTIGHIPQNHGAKGPFAGADTGGDEHAAHPGPAAALPQLPVDGRQGSCVSCGSPPRHRSTIRTAYEELLSFS